MKSIAEIKDMLQGMMEESYEVKESKVKQGELVFIVHKDKVFKSGWWRKVKHNNGSYPSSVVYVLEKSATVTPDDLSHYTKTDKSRVEHGYFLINGYTIRTDPEKYNIIGIFGGLAQNYILDNNYLLGHNIEALTLLDAFEGEINLTNNAVDLFSAYYAKYVTTTELNSIEKLVNEML